MIDCNDCPHINITEEQQEHMWQISRNIANEKLQELIARIGTYRPRNDNWISTPDMWTYELNHNPQNFYRNGNGELIWLGYKVEVIMTFSGAEEQFWALADKIIPKEN